MVTAQSRGENGFPGPQEGGCKGQEDHGTERRAAGRHHDARCKKEHQGYCKDPLPGTEAFPVAERIEERHSVADGQVDGRMVDVTDGMQLKSGDRLCKVKLPETCGQCGRGGEDHGQQGALEMPLAVTAALQGPQEKHVAVDVPHPPPLAIVNAGKSGNHHRCRQPEQDGGVPSVPFAPEVPASDPVEQPQCHVCGPEDVFRAFHGRQGHNEQEQNSIFNGMLPMKDFSKHAFFFHIHVSLKDAADDFPAVL